MRPSLPNVRPKTARTSLIIVIAALSLSHAAAAIPACPPDTGQRLAVARAILGEPQEALMTQRDREALYCLVDAIAAQEAETATLLGLVITQDAEIKELQRQVEALAAE